jgi:hypothetical protein
MAMAAWGQRWRVGKAASRAWWIAILLAVGCASSGKASSADPVVLDEPSLMAKLRLQVKTAPATALSLADEGEQRFGDSPAAEERRALALSALINLQRIGSARSRAYDFLRRYPNGPYTAHVATMTGVHSPPARPDAGPGTHTCDAR